MRRYRGPCPRFSRAGETFDYKLGTVLVLLRLDPSGSAIGPDGGGMVPEDEPVRCRSASGTPAGGHDTACDSPRDVRGIMLERH